MTSTRQHARRKLAFHDVSGILHDVGAIKDAHETVGRWTLGQICAHLAASFDGSIDGFDYSRHRVKRAMVSRPMLWYTFLFGIPEQYLVDPGIEPTGDVSMNDGMTRLARAIHRYRDHGGALFPHPLFGRMSRRQWDRIHCIHAAHHLSFVRPADHC